MLNAVPVRVCLDNICHCFVLLIDFSIINIYIHLIKAIIFAHSHVDKSNKYSIHFFKSFKRGLDRSVLLSAAPTTSTLEENKLGKIKVSSLCSIKSILLF